MGEPEIDDPIFPAMGEDLPSLLRVVLGVLVATANRWCVFSKLNLRLSLIIFPIRPFLRVRGHDHTSFVSFVYVPLQGIFWSKSHIVWTLGCAWWLMS